MDFKKLYCEALSPFGFTPDHFYVVQTGLDKFGLGFTINFTGIGLIGIRVNYNVKNTKEALDDAFRQVFDRARRIGYSEAKLEIRKALEG